MMGELSNILLASVDGPVHITHTCRLLKIPHSLGNLIM
jgi:hypothetical protein